MDYRFRSNRLLVLERWGETDRAENIEKSILRPLEKTYIALKNGDYEFAERALRLRISTNERICSDEILRLEAADISEKSEIERRIEGRRKQLDEFYSLLTQIEQRNTAYIRSCLEETEIASRARIESFFEKKPNKKSS